METTAQKTSRGKVLFLAIGILIGFVVGYFIGYRGYIRFENDPIAENEIEELNIQEGSIEPNSVTMVAYSHDWMDYAAMISMHNNTDKVITSISGRMVYYDMKGNMLDYQDFVEKINIDVNMTKQFKLAGYNHDEYYAYYKSKSGHSQTGKKYKVEFQLKSCTFK